jgi:hypothetical protein
MDTPAATMTIARVEMLSIDASARRKACACGTVSLHGAASAPWPSDTNAVTSTPTSLRRTPGPDADTVVVGLCEGLRDCDGVVACEAVCVRDWLGLGDVDGDCDWLAVPD